MKKYKHIMLNLLFIAALALPLSGLSQLKAYSFTELNSLQNVQKKNIVLFIHTDWCRYCQAMKNSSFKNKEVVKLLNENFLFAELNGEERKDIFFKGQTFKYKPTGANTGSHELAEALGTINGKLSYPTLCILNANNEIIFQHDQFLSSTEMIKLLREVAKTTK